MESWPSVLFPLVSKQPRAPSAGYFEESKQWKIRDENRSAFDLAWLWIRGQEFIASEIQIRTKGGFETTKEVVSHSCVLTLILRSNSERWKETRIEKCIERGDTTFEKERESKTFRLLDAWCYGSKNKERPPFTVPRLLRCC